MMLAIWTGWLKNYHSDVYAPLFFSLKLCLCWFSTCFRLLWICLKLLLCYFEGSPYCKPPCKFEPFSKLSFFPFFFRILALVKSFFCITFYRIMIQPCSNKWNESIEKDSRFEPAKNRGPYCKPLPYDYFVLSECTKCLSVFSEFCIN